MIPLDPRKVNYLIVHHSATPRDTTRFISIKNYHTKIRGWEDIGYHYFIDGKGRIWKGRSEQYVGDHCRTPGLSMNFFSLGICLAGNFQVENPSPEQLISLEQLLNQLRKKYEIPAENVLGHREVPKTNTICPGINLIAWLKKYREKYKEEPKSSTNKIILQIIKKLIEKLRKQQTTQKA